MWALILLCDLLIIKCWGKFAKDIGKKVQKRFFVDEPSVVEKLTANEVDEIYPRGSSYWGTNARCIGSRMRLIG